MNDFLHRAGLLTEFLQLDITSLEGQVAAKDTTGQDGRVVDVDDSGGRSSLRHDVYVDWEELLNRGARRDG